MQRPHVLQIQQTCDQDFIRRIERESGQQVSKCYQCGNCGASCGYTFAFDFPVNQIMRLVQLGQKDTVLRSQAIWLCAKCQACTTRCPCNIEVARVMEALRVMSVEEGVVSARNIQMFYDEFLDSVRHNGRVFEPGLLARYNLKAFKPFTDVDLGPVALMKGKVTLWPHKIKGRKAIEEIFKRFESHRGQSLHHK